MADEVTTAVDPEVDDAEEQYGANLTPEHRHYTEAMKEVAKRAKVPQAHTKRVVAALIDVVLEGLLSDKQHANLGSFGSFKLIDAAEGRVRNPRAEKGSSNEFLLAPARKKMRFEPGSKVEGLIKRHFNIGESRPLTQEEAAKYATAPAAPTE